ncbi:TetR/AcrR family transcriptional regulator [Desulfobacterales bacterium HSG16]|nr:TetR/AcrR family transcriptional regulator [Desulfobacterales bacterium HSG16]
MITPLEKARQNPGSMKARILNSARRLFGDYGFHGVTTRMVAKDVGIDISTLHYHWGDKQNLYESVVADVNDEICEKLIEIEKKVHGKSLRVRLEVAIEVMADYLFDNPEASNLILFSYFGKTRPDSIMDSKMSEYVTNIAIAMGLAPDKMDVSPQANARVLAVWNSVINFTSGENLFRSILDVDRKQYIEVVKETLRFILIPAFTKE